MLTTIAAGRVYDYSHCVGRFAHRGMGFSNPSGLGLGAGDVVYVVSRGSEYTNGVAWDQTGMGSRVHICTMGTVPGDESFVGDFGAYGTSDGQFIWPQGIVVDGQRNVYVADEWLNRVSIFDAEGSYLGHWGTVPDGDDGPNGASSLAMDIDENVYVVDGRSHQVRKFTKEGKFLGSWGGYGTGKGEFNGPWGIDVDDQGYVYVADHRNHRVQKLSSEGECVAQFGSYGTRPGQLQYPTDVAVDPDGDVYICDWSENGWEEGRVHIFDRDGTFITSLIGDAQELSKWAQMEVDANADVAQRRREVPTLEPEWRFAQPRAVVFDPAKGRLMVVDTQRARVQIYNKAKDYVQPQLNL